MGSPYCKTSKVPAWVLLSSTIVHLEVGLIPKWVFLAGVLALSCVASICPIWQSCRLSCWINTQNFRFRVSIPWGKSRRLVLVWCTLRRGDDIAKMHFLLMAGLHWNTDVVVPLCTFQDWQVIDARVPIWQHLISSWQSETLVVCHMDNNIGQYGNVDDNRNHCLNIWKSWYHYSPPVLWSGFVLSSYSVEDIFDIRQITSYSVGL